jgi:hypothetical protein
MAIFNLAEIIKAAIKAISTLLEMVAPDEMTPEEKVSWQKYIGTAYAAAKNFGPDVVKNSANDLDDVVLNELIEVCELAASKYGLTLDPTQL